MGIFPFLWPAPRLFLHRDVVFHRLTVGEVFAHVVVLNALLERLLAVHGKFLLPGFLLNGGEGYLLLTPFPGRLLFRLHSVGID